MADQDWIKSALKARGHKLKDVADILKITPPRVSDILKGAREVQADEIIPLATLLGMTPTALLKSLEVGRPIYIGENSGPALLPVEGQLTGGGALLPLDPSIPFSTVSAPPDAQKSEGLRCFIMGDDSLARDIHPGSIVIAADPKLHFAPIVPDTLLLLNPGDGRLLPRLFHQAPDGKNWLIACPKTPNPAYETFSFEPMAQAPSKSYKPGAPLNLSHIVAVIQWIHRRYS